MKNLLALALVLLAALAVLPGCNNGPPPKDPEPGAQTAPKTSMLTNGLELIRQAPNAERYWEGLQLLNAHNQQKASAREGSELKPEQRAFLKTEAALTDEEIEEVQSPTYRRADAHHVAECFLLRDAVRSLDVSGMPPAELAAQVLAWVDRHVLLHEQGDDWLPPAEVLQRGYGSLSDRARLFLAMLRQVPMEGCAIVLPNAPEEVVLIGAFPFTARDLHLQKAAKLYLFDPRRGGAIRTRAGAIATLDDVQKDGTLLAGTGLDAKQLAGAPLRLACPLNAMPTRMADLERSLLALDRVVVHADPAALKDDFARLAHRPVQIWNSPGADGRTPNSPTRALRLFLPTKEGGIDQTGRYDRFQADLLPLADVRRALEQRYLVQTLPPEAFKRLATLIDGMLTKYDLQPHMMLLHGRGDDAVRRLGRAQMFFDDENLDNLASDPKFDRAVAEWRDTLTRLHAALLNGAPEAQAKINSFWVEDQFILTLLHTEGEDRLNNATSGQDRMKPPQKTTTTSIVAYTVRDYLKQRALWLRAMVWHDKAVREQDRADREKDEAKREQRRKHVHGTWANTRVAWNQIKDRAGGTAANRAERLNAIHKLLESSSKGNAVDAAQLLASLHLELHQHYAANLDYALAVAHLDGPKAALAILHTIDDEIAKLLAEGKSGQGGLQRDIDPVLTRLRSASAPPGVIHSTELLKCDWTPHGNYYWIRQRIARQITEWEKKK